MKLYDARTYRICRKRYNNYIEHVITRNGIPWLLALYLIYEYGFNFKTVLFSIMLLLFLYSMFRYVTGGFISSALTKINPLYVRLNFYSTDLSSGVRNIYSVFGYVAFSFLSQLFYISGLVFIYFSTSIDVETRKILSSILQVLIFGNFIVMIRAGIVSLLKPFIIKNSLSFQMNHIKSKIQKKLSKPKFKITGITLLVCFSNLSINFWSTSRKFINSFIKVSISLVSLLFTLFITAYPEIIKELIENIKKILT